MVSELEILGVASLALFDVLTFFAAGSWRCVGDDTSVSEGAIVSCEYAMEWRATRIVEC